MCLQTGIQDGIQYSLPPVRPNFTTFLNVYQPHFLCGSSAIFCIGSGLQAGAPSLDVLTLGRAVGGLGVGALRYALNLFVRRNIGSNGPWTGNTQHVVAALHGRDKSTGTPWFPHGSRTTCDRVRCCIRILDGLSDAEQSVFAVIIPQQFYVYVLQFLVPRPGAFPLPSSSFPVYPSVWDAFFCRHHPGSSFSEEDWMTQWHHSLSLDCALPKRLHAIH